jgi:D-glycero-alpha-D-manno-heptose 1-phosphate guanylyltransferase
MIKEAIILAGGLGTRLRSVVSDLPKCMAPVNGIPFINFVITYLSNEGVEKIILSLGYKSEIVVEYITRTFPGTRIEFVIEDKPLGTGGATRLACSKAEGDNVLVLNGDTLFNIDLKRLSQFHIEKNADFSVALKEMKQFSRYGTVEVDNDQAITAFREKSYCEKGFINGGVYALNKRSFLLENTPEVFSFEQDFLEENVQKKRFFGIDFDYYFIDIGVPEDYKRFTEDYNFILAKSKYEKQGLGDRIAGNFFEGLTELIKQ